MALTYILNTSWTNWKLNITCLYLINVATQRNAIRISLIVSYALQDSVFDFDRNLFFTVTEQIIFTIKVNALEILLAVCSVALIGNAHEQTQ